MCAFCVCVSSVLQCSLALGLLQRTGTIPVPLDIWILPMKKLVLFICIFKSSRASVETLDVGYVLLISFQMLVLVSYYHRIRDIKFISSMDPVLTGSML